MGVMQDLTLCCILINKWTPWALKYSKIFKKRLFVYTKTPQGTSKVWGVDTGLTDLSSAVCGQTWLAVFKYFHINLVKNKCESTTEFFPHSVPWRSNLMKTKKDMGWTQIKKDTACMTATWTELKLLTYDYDEPCKKKSWKYQHVSLTARLVRFMSA